ncbi:hypothetical protein R1sor_013568 [Riccia sorocarpa]|uniref:Uncharacterized protein n=1 Tax=Riccia sorocarpa TaxID=122646 RepID=A0ABD3HD43_9MARC
MVVYALDILEVYYLEFHDIHSNAPHPMGCLEANIQTVRLLVEVGVALWRLCYLTGKQGLQSYSSRHVNTCTLLAATEDIRLGLAVDSRGGDNVRVPLLLILIGKGSAYRAGLAEVGGEEFFSFSSKTNEDRRARAKLLENPYLQMRGKLQLPSECDSPSFQSES